MRMRAGRKSTEPRPVNRKTTDVIDRALASHPRLVPDVPDVGMGFGVYCRTFCSRVNSLGFSTTRAVWEVVVHHRALSDLPPGEQADSLSSQACSSLRMLFARRPPKQKDSPSFCLRHQVTVRREAVHI
jgi:hypothetical protein